MNWIFKNNLLGSVGNTAEDFSVRFYQKQNFSAKPGERVLILGMKKGEWQFIAEYSIAKIEINPDEEYKEITVFLKLEKKFDDKLLTDYIYSLRTITHFDYPMRHFTRKYRRLNDAEYDAIVNDKIYVKRTIVGTVLNAMHVEHQKAFIEFVAENEPGLLVGNADMDEIYNLLVKYMDFAIVKPSQYLRESANILQSVLTSEEYDGIGFGSDIERLGVNNTQRIKSQVLIIEENLSSLEQFVNQGMDNEISGFEDKSNLERYFRNSPLPISLKYY